MEWTIPAFAFPAKAGSHLPKGWKAELTQAPPRWVNSLPKTATWRLSQMLAAKAVASHRATGAQGNVELTISRAASHDANHWATELIQ